MDIPEIGVDELAGLLNSSITLIDVREPDEYVEARVPGASLIPLDTIPDRMSELPDEHLYLICAKGGRSLKAAEYLSTHGWECTNVAGGTQGWVEAGHRYDVG